MLSLPNARFVRGNHDDIFDMVLSGQRLRPHPQAADPVSAFLWFTNYGLTNTLDSYGVDWLEVEWVRHHPTEAGVSSSSPRCPRTHRQFVRSLPAVIEEPDLFVAHAMWGPDDPDDAPPIAERAWPPTPRRSSASCGAGTAPSSPGASVAADGLLRPHAGRSLPRLLARRPQ